MMDVRRLAEVSAIIIHDGLERILRVHIPRCPAPEDFVFTTPGGAPIDEANFVRQVWRPALEELRIRPRPFYNCRHSYISTLIAAGAKPLFVCRQTGTSLEMIEKHYGDARVDAELLDHMIDEHEAPSRNPAGTVANERTRPSAAKNAEATVSAGVPKRAGDRGRTGDVQLGKLIDEGPGDYDPWG